MKKTLVLCIVLTVQSLVCSSQSITEQSNKLLEAVIKEQQVVGTSASLSINGEVAWEAAVGYANKEAKIEFKIDTEIRTASIAKSMTAVAVMQLVEQGLIDIDTPIDTYIPEFIQSNTTKITTRHILTHTSGIDAYKNEKEIENKVNYKTLLDAYAVFKDRELLFEPGSNYHYTSYGYVVLGILIEKVTNESYENYMQKHIWDKAGMTHTGIEKPGIKRPNSAALYHKNRKGKIKKAKANNLSNRIPAGGFYSTIGDLTKFGNALLSNKLVSEETLKLMCQHHSLEKVNNSYGFGFFLYGKSPNVGSIYGHNGAQTGSSTQLFIVPSLNAVIIAVSNTSGAGREISTVAGQLIAIAQNNG
ncbi:MAG: class A beta-lactamase-related serine hydrolase [Winogradskyella sp.]|uniref:serine hydrolase domain-containing protein n=1 Tax=Winogradskyella sp. TaxID=1883156 RepID=UPI000F4005F4|nr:serine hydrolase domain-containing protein [Winogradskyella sp.]RNC86766.1 MAG: class A beta-lactamase-related serine hydrolase [Winogradskyella sp.]